MPSLFDISWQRWRMNIFILNTHTQTQTHVYMLRTNRINKYDTKTPNKQTNKKNCCYVRINNTRYSQIHCLFYPLKTNTSRNLPITQTIFRRLILAYIQFACSILFFFSWKMSVSYIHTGVLVFCKISNLSKIPSSKLLGVSGDYEKSCITVVQVMPTSTKIVCFQWSSYFLWKIAFPEFLTFIT